MPLSSDPEKRERQLKNLAAGRAVAKTRREAGLGRKRSSARVVDGGYQDHGGDEGRQEPVQPKRQRAAKRAASSEPSPAWQDSQEPPRWARTLGRIMGIDG